jgi:hypothetical protein
MYGNNETLDIQDKHTFYSPYTLQYIGCFEKHSTTTRASSVHKNNEKYMNTHASLDDLSYAQFCFVRKRIKHTPQTQPEEVFDMSTMSPCTHSNIYVCFELTFIHYIPRTPGSFAGMVTRL